jgi:hypothetical protein
VLLALLPLLPISHPSAPFAFRRLAPFIFTLFRLELFVFSFLLA